MKSSISHPLGTRNSHPHRGQIPGRPHSRASKGSIPGLTTNIPCSGQQDGPLALDWPPMEFGPLEQASKRLLFSGPLAIQTGSRSSQVTSVVRADPLTVSSSSYGMEIGRPSRPPAPNRHLENDNPTFAFVGKCGDLGRGKLLKGPSDMEPSSQQSRHSMAAAPVVISSWSSDPRSSQYTARAPRHFALRGAASERPEIGQRNQMLASSPQWQLAYASDIIRSNSVLANQHHSGSFEPLDPPVGEQRYGKPHTSGDLKVPYTRDHLPQMMQTKQGQTSHRKDANRSVSCQYTNSLPTAREKSPNMVSFLTVIPSPQLSDICGSRMTVAYLVEIWPGSCTKNRQRDH